MNCLMLSASFLVLTSSVAAINPSIVTPQPMEVNAYGDVPLYFEPNVGQVSSSAQFLARGSHTTLLSARGMVLDRSGGPSSPGLQIQFIGANPSAASHGMHPLGGHSTYYQGGLPSKPYARASHFSTVKYSSIYLGIDLVYYGTGSKLEHDFVVHPGADPRQIKFAALGAASVQIGSDGSLLLLNTTNQPIRLGKPNAYQLEGSHRTNIRCSFRLEGKSTVHFDVGHFDHSKALVIDPVLLYGTYIDNRVSPKAMTVDARGNVYLTGSATPTREEDGRYAFRSDVFVMKLSSTGTKVEYVTYLGGRSIDQAFGIAIDTEGSAYITGETYSSEFPITPGSYQTRLLSGSSSLAPKNAFVVKLRSNGTVDYSTYLGSANSDVGYSVAVDSRGNCYVTGSSTTAFTNPTFPTTPGAFMATRTGNGYAFITKLNSTGSALVYSTLLGGRQTSSPSARGLYVQVDDFGTAYIAGDTSATDFPTTAGAYQTAIKKTGGDTSIFALRLNAAGTALLYSTYLAGTGDDELGGMAVDAFGSMYLAGVTTSRDFPTTSSAFQRTFRGIATRSGNIYYSGGKGTSSAGDAFVARLNPAGSSLIYSTYLGGTLDEGAYGIAVDGAGNAIVTGMTNSLDFPTTANAVASQFAGGLFDGFVAVLNPTGSSLIYSTYFGTADWDSGNSVFADAAGDLYIAGSGVFPTSPDAYIRNPNAGGRTPFVAKLSNMLSVELLSVDVNLLRFSHRMGDAPPAYQVITVRSSRSTLAFTVESTNSNWIVVDALVGRTPRGVTVTVNPIGLSPGVHEGSLIIKAEGAGNSPQRVTVRLEIAASISPTVAEGAVVNGASLQGGLAAGSWFTIYGSNLAAITRSWGAGDIKGTNLPTSLDGTAVEINGIPVAVSFISPTQVNAQAPDGPIGPVTVRVVTSRGRSADIGAVLQRYSPAFFQVSSQGRIYAIAVHTDGSLVAEEGSFGVAVPSRPANPGEIVTLYGTGFGPTTPNVSSGQTVGGPASLPTSGLLSIQLGGIPTEVLFAGLTGVGLYQFNIRVPELGDGEQSINVTIGGVRSPTLVLSIRRR